MRYEVFKATAQSDLLLQDITRGQESTGGVDSAE